jgi:prevent-host-death family protein
MCRRAADRLIKCGSSTNPFSMGRTAADPRRSLHARDRLGHEATHIIDLLNGPPGRVENPREFALANQVLGLFDSLCTVSKLTNKMARSERYVNIAQAKARLSELVEKADSGEEIVIARDHQPVAKLVPVRGRAQRTPGSAKGQVSIAPDFDETPSDFADYTK